MFVCSHCTFTTNSKNNPSWFEHQLQHIGNENISPEEFHLKILQAKAKRMVYYIDADEFIDRFDKKIENLSFLPELNVAGTPEKMFPLVQEYKRRRDSLYARRIFFSSHRKLMDCLDKWTPIKVIGYGKQGSVYQFCDAFSCNYAAKITFQSDDQETKMYTKAAEIGVAPLVHDSFQCGKARVLVTEMYSGNLYPLLKETYERADERGLATIFEKVFSLIYRLSKEANILHNDTKICNIVQNGIDDIKLIDYGVSKYKTGQIDDALVLLQQINSVFMPSLAKPTEWCTDIDETDPFDICHPNEQDLIVTVIRRVINSNPQWKILKGEISYVF